MDAQTFEDYKSKYLDLYDKVRTGKQKEKVSILDDIDFEVELIRNDIINVSYIIKLLSHLHTAKPKDQAQQKKQILGILDTEAQLRSKKELIERFISEQMPQIPKDGDVEAAFDDFWNAQKQQAVQTLSEEEGLDAAGLQKLIGDYLYTEKLPLTKEVVPILNQPPKLKDRKTVTGRIVERIKAFVQMFVEGVD